MVAFMLASCAAPASTRGTPTPAARTNTACVSRSVATRIWSTVDARLNAIELDPKHAGVAAVTTGNALTTISAYLQRQLVNEHLTEHEVDQLDQLTVVQAGCNGGLLILNVSMRLVQDDYLNAAGKVDHHDASVGKVLNLLQEYALSDGVWKETDFSNLSPPGASPTPNVV